MKYEVVKYQPEFRNQVVELQQYLWSGDIVRNSAYLEWKYENNPYMDIPVIYVALYKGKVVGMRGMYGAKWQMGDPLQTFVGPCAGDLVILPEHRNRGLIGKMTKAAVDNLARNGYTYVFNLSAGAITYVSLLALGWRSLGSVRTVHRKEQRETRSNLIRRMADRVPVLSSAYCRGKRWLSKVGVSRSEEKRDPFYLLETNFRKRGMGGKAVVCVEHDPRPRDMAKLVEGIAVDGRIRHVRDEEYLAWRYRNPLSQYRFVFWEDGRLQGYLVLRASVCNTPRGDIRIVDWEATTPEIGAELLRLTIEWGKFADLTIWSASMSEEANNTLQKAGFSYVSEQKSITANKPAVLIGAVRDDMRNADWIRRNRHLLDLSNWDLRLLYSDSV